MNSILVVGSAALDTIETAAGKADDCVGGSALYFTAGASLFAPVSVVSVVGKDFPHKKIEFLAQRKVDLGSLEIADGKTFRWGGRYDKNLLSRETLFTELNTFETFEPKIPEHLQNTDLLFLGNILPELQMSVLNQITKPKFVLLDTMNLWINHRLEALLQVIAKVDAIVVNDEEVRQLTGFVNIPKAVKKLHSMGPKLVIVKRGEHGATLHHVDGDFFALPALPIEEVVDPTGCGDSFAGGFIGRLAMEGVLTPATFRRALVSGTVVASFTVQAFGLDRLVTVTPSELAAQEAKLLSAVRVP